MTEKCDPQGLQEKSRKQRFTSTQEPSEAPDASEANAEHALQPKTPFKAVRSGAFDTLEQVPEPLSIKK